VAKSASRTSDHPARKAETRFRELLDELRLLTVAFPHLREAVDPNDLPVSFLLRRGADRAATRARRPAKTQAPVATKGTKKR